MKLNPAIRYSSKPRCRFLQAFSGASFGRSENAAKNRRRGFEAAATIGAKVFGFDLTFWRIFANFPGDLTGFSKPVRSGGETKKSVAPEQFVLDQLLTFLRENL